MPDATRMTESEPAPFDDDEPPPVVAERLRDLIDPFRRLAE